MVTNSYFSQGSNTEKALYEDIIIESLKMYGQNCYYIPREIVNRDLILNDDSTSRFDEAYLLEMYIENIEGFDGDGDLFAKFGVEIRDAATFILSRKRWQETVEANETGSFYRPREGDLIVLTLSNSIFEIQKVEDETPFYQLKNLPVFRMRCELFEYNDEDFDTGIDSIDSIEREYAYTTLLQFDQTTFSVPNSTYSVGEEITQDNGTYTMEGEISSIDSSNPSEYKIGVIHTGSTDGKYHSWSSSNPIVGSTSSVSETPTAIDGEDFNDNAQNKVFDDEAREILVFTESNPFGDPL